MKPLLLLLKSNVTWSWLYRQVTIILDSHIILHRWKQSVAAFERLSEWAFLISSQLVIESQVVRRIPCNKPSSPHVIAWWLLRRLIYTLSELTSEWFNSGNWSVNTKKIRVYILYNSRFIKRKWKRTFCYWKLQKCKYKKWKCCLIRHWAVFCRRLNIMFVLTGKRDTFSQNELKCCW